MWTYKYLLCFLFALQATGQNYGRRHMAGRKLAMPPKPLYPGRLDGGLLNAAAQIADNVVAAQNVAQAAAQSANIAHNIAKDTAHIAAKVGINVGSGAVFPTGGKIYPKSAMPRHPKPNLPFHPKPLFPGMNPFGQQLEKQIVHDQIKMGGPIFPPQQKPLMPIHPKPIMPIPHKPKFMGGGIGAALNQVGGIGRDAPWLKGIIGKDIDMGGQIMVGGHNKWPRHGGAGGGHIFANGLRDGWGADSKLPMVPSVSNWQSPLGAAPIPIDYAGGPLPGLIVAHNIAKDTTHIARKSGIGGVPGALFPTDPFIDPVEHGMMKQAGHIARKTIGPLPIAQFGNPLHNMEKDIIHNQVKIGGIIDPVDQQMGKHIVHKQIKTGGTFIPLYPQAGLPKLPFHPKPFNDPFGPGIGPVGHQIEKQIVHGQIKTGGIIPHPKPKPIMPFNPNPNMPFHPKPLMRGIDPFGQQIEKQIVHNQIKMGGPIFPPRQKPLMPIHPKPLMPIRPKPLMPIHPKPLMPNYPKPLMPNHPKPLMPNYPKPLMPIRPKPLMPIHPKRLMPIHPKPLMPNYPKPLMPIHPKPLMPFHPKPIMPLPAKPMSYHRRPKLPIHPKPLTKGIDPFGHQIEKDIFHDQIKMGGPIFPPQGGPIFPPQGGPIFPQQKPLMPFHPKPIMPLPAKPMPFHHKPKLPIHPKPLTKGMDPFGHQIEKQIVHDQIKMGGPIFPPQQKPLMPFHPKPIMPLPAKPMSYHRRPKLPIHPKPHTMGMDPFGHQIEKQIIHDQIKMGGPIFPQQQKPLMPIHPKPIMPFPAKPMPFHHKPKLPIHPKPLMPGIDPFGHQIEKQIVHNQIKMGGPIFPPQGGPIFPPQGGPIFPQQQKPLMPIHPKPIMPIPYKPKFMGGGIGAALKQVGGVGRDAPWLKGIIGKDIDMGGQIMVGGHNKWPRHGGAGGGELFANGLRDGWGSDSKLPMVPAVSNWQSPLGAAPIPIDYAGGPLPGLVIHNIAKETRHIARKSGVLAPGIGPAGIVDPVHPAKIGAVGDPVLALGHNIAKEAMHSAAKTVDFGTHGAISGGDPFARQVARDIAQEAILVAAQTVAMSPNLGKAGVVGHKGGLGIGAFGGKPKPLLHKKKLQVLGGSYPRRRW